MYRTDPRIRIGDQDTYATVWEWGLRGSNKEIGYALASWGRDALGTMPLPTSDPASIGAQHRFFRTHYSPFHSRMTGVADAAGVQMDEALHDLSALWFDVGMPGCSAGFVPGGRMANGHTHVLRNMDLGVDLTGDVEHPPSSRIVMLDMAPDEGYASLSVVVFDLMGAMDGINEKGLVVICNSHGDYRLDKSYAYEPIRQPEPGLNEMQIVRYLLDMCADVDEAREALLSLRTYYRFTPCLYMIADARGRAFVCEKSSSGNRISLTESNNAPLAMTNFGLSRFANGEDMPEEDGLDQGFAYTRYRTVKHGIESGELLAAKELRSIAREASFDVLCEPRVDNDMHPDRTIYTTLYDVDARKITISCYLGEEEGGTTHSEPVDFKLGGTLEDGNELEQD
jgi:acyl-CoA:6-aminopenicillanic acid acyl transferase